METMTTEEQEFHLATLIVQERKIGKTIQCLISKVRQVKEVAGILEKPWGFDLADLRKNQSQVLDTNLRKLFDDLEKELNRHGSLLEDIEKIEPGYRSRRR